jgi:hypothetical protein
LMTVALERTASEVAGDSADSRSGLGEDSAFPVGALHPLERHEIGRGARVLPEVEALAGLFRGVVCGGHQPTQLAIDLFEFPALIFLVLHPLEVGDDHPAPVAQNVRDDVDPFFAQHLVGRGRRRAIRGLRDHLHVDITRVALVDLALERRRDQDVGLDLP